MRFFWSVVLAGGLLLVGLDAYESRREARSDSRIRPGIALAEDGTPFPPPPPPPP